MSTWATYSRRLRRAPGYYAKGLYRQISDKDIFLWAQAIAFKVLITIVPVIILATGIVGRVLQQERPFEVVRNFIEDFLPPYRSEGIINFLQQLADSQQLADASWTLFIVGISGLLFSAVILFTTLRITVGNVFQEDWHESRTIVGGYLFDIRMVGQVGLFFLLSFGLTLTVQSISTSGFAFIEQIGLDYVWVKTGWRRTFKGLGLLIPFLFTTAMFFQLIYFVPKPHPPKRSALVGALTTAVLWEVAKYAFTIYATRIGRFDYGSAGEDAEGASVLGDTFGIIIAFVFWVYYSGIVLLVGAVVALLHEKAHRSRRAAASAEAAIEEAARNADAEPNGSEARESETRESESREEESREEESQGAPPASVADASAGDVPDDDMPDDETAGQIAPPPASDAVSAEDAPVRS